jgi:hypothetical protein
MKDGQSRMNYAAELKACGCKMDLQAFKELVQDTFAEMYKGTITDEDLTSEPFEAIEFCGAIRYRTRCRSMPHGLILRVLTNNRKNGEGINAA